MTMDSIFWPGLAFFFLCLAISLFLRKSAQKDLTSRTNDTVTEKKRLTKSLTSYASDLVKTLPPSRRDKLHSILPTLSPSQQKALGDLSAPAQISECSLLRLDQEYTDADDSKFIYSGFTVGEVKALGDFPDYATLAGVPLPQPYSAFDIDKAKPRPYRPLRWPYHQTMYLKKFQPDWWIELESTYRERIAQRKALYDKYGSTILQWLPGSELAFKELMEMVIQFICARYPQYFALSEDKLWLENRILGVRANIRAKHPLFILLDHVPEDFVIVERDPETGLYVHHGGVICSALGFTLASTIGRNLPDIHKEVPDYQEKMQLSMDRYFSKMPTDKPVQRGSWELEPDQPLFLAPDDQDNRQEDGQSTELTRERLHLRVDWQTLRRLPLSGAVAFNFKALFTPIEELRTEPYVPSVLLKILKHGNEKIMEYKGTQRTQHVCIPAMEEFEREQLEKGLIEKNWEVGTLEENPWFPGWEEKWHAQQGF
ncbi:alpha-1,2-mannosyltransferase [Xylaria nigripes]|nr:alpha-1,2-mannosyltransferase [Xylaria nigripes]